MKLDKINVIHSLDLKGISIIVKNMDIELMSTNSRQNLTRHKRNKHIYQEKVILTIGIITHGIIITTMERMDTF